MAMHTSRPKAIYATKACTALRLVAGEATNRTSQLTYGARRFLNGDRKKTAICEDKRVKGVFCYLVSGRSQEGEQKEKCNNQYPPRTEPLRMLMFKCIDEWNEWNCEGKEEHAKERLPV